MNQNKDIITKVEPLISRFCKIILTDKDCLSNNEAEVFINSLTDTEKSELNLLTANNEREIRSTVLTQLITYLQTFQVENAIGSPFAFDNSDNFIKYRQHFENTYSQVNNNHPLPYVFAYAFDYIQHTSEHYRIFEQFYSVRSLETSNNILSKTQIVAKEKAEEGVREGIAKAVRSAAREAAKEAAHQASVYAEVAAQNAKTAMEEAKTAAKSAVKEAVDNQINNVTSKISETSVTILGIFSGIVLTVVAGLFYSSSVLESINTANFFRLLAVASTVGLVCYHLLALMFRFIEKIKGVDDKKKNGISIFINIILILSIIIFSILQFTCPQNNEELEVSSTTSIYTEIDVDTKQENASQNSSYIDDTTSIPEIASANNAS